MKFFKLYNPPTGRKPRAKIGIFYHGVPLFSNAVFDQDRYVFQLPVNLRDKMITGNLFADLCYADSDSGSLRNPTPVSLVISDRYD